MGENKGGSVFLSDQKLPIMVSRIRDQGEDKWVRLGSFEELQAARNRNEGELKPILCGLLLEP